jgi:predicted ABC-type ATPase
MGEVLPSDHPLLAATVDLPNREGLRNALVGELLSGMQNPPMRVRPTAWFNAGGLGVGKVALFARLQEVGAVPRAGLVVSDADQIHGMIPEYKMLVDAGDGRASSVVHEEASLISRAAFGKALEQGLSVMHNSMLSSDSAVERLRQAKRAGHRVVVMLTTASVERSRERAGQGGRYVPLRTLLQSHQGVAARFNTISEIADVVFLLDNNGPRPRLVATSNGGELKVLDADSFDAFMAAHTLDPLSVPPDQPFFK